MNQDEGGDEVSPIIENAKKRPQVVLEIPKKQKISTTLVIQEQITKLAKSASSFTSKARWNFNQGSDGSCFGVRGWIW
jgi:hypothetical protein